MSKPRHYHDYNNEGPQGVVQVDSQFRDRDIRPSLPESILRLAWEEYHRQHPGQSFERIQQRGGFWISEVTSLLADYVERLEAASKGERDE